MITGEPIPAEKKLGDKVTSGTINGNQVFLMKTEKNWQRHAPFSNYRNGQLSKSK